MLKKICIVIATAFSLLLSFPFVDETRAHPHEWIDIKTELNFNDDGKLASIRMDWLLDEFSTAYTMESTLGVSNVEISDLALEKLAATIVGNLEEFSYLTVFEPDDQVEIKEAIPFKGQMDGIRFNFQFDLVFAEPVDLSGRSLTYAVYDPLYYIELLHRGEDQAVVLKNAPEACAATIEAPDPAEAQIAYAQSLDRNDQAEEGLGGFFAEKVEISCQ